MERSNAIQPSNNSLVRKASHLTIQLQSTAMRSTNVVRQTSYSWLKFMAFVTFAKIHTNLVITNLHTLEVNIYPQYNTEETITPPTRGIDNSFIACM